MDTTVRDQIEKLPLELTKFLAYSEWDDLISSIGDEYKLPDAQFNTFHQEVFLVLLGLTHPDGFRDEIINRLEIEIETLDALILEVEEKIFVPIRPALIQFFESEQAIAEEDEAPIEIQTPEQEMLLEETPDVAPENLPIEEGVESFLPNLIPKVATSDSQPVHPFEEKMKMAFTGTPATADTENIIPLIRKAPPPAQTNTPNITPLPSTESLRHDPYREAIE